MRKRKRHVSHNRQVPGERSPGFWPRVSKWGFFKPRGKGPGNEMYETSVSSMYVVVLSRP